jgi:hypothetical protein
MEVELETFEEEEEEEEDTTELGEVQELGTEILEMILEQVFGALELTGKHNGPIITSSPGACGR